MMMKKDFKIYNYYTTCPNCSNFNTRINKALDLKYVLCYTCSLVFRPTDEELKKISTPLPIQISVHNNFKKFHEKEINYLENINKKNINTDFNADALNLEIRKKTLLKLSEFKNKNCVIISNNESLINNQDNKINIVSATSIKEIEKIIYTKVLKNGKIDLLIIENLQNLIISDLLIQTSTALSFDANILIYSPIINNIYNNYYNYIISSKYIHNLFTMFYSVARINYNLYFYEKLDNFYLLTAKAGVNTNKNFIEEIEGLIQEEIRNIIYSEPLFLVS